MAGVAKGAQGGMAATAKGQLSCGQLRGMGVNAGSEAGGWPGSVWVRSRMQPLNRHLKCCESSAIAEPAPGAAGLAHHPIVAVANQAFQSDSPAMTYRAGVSLVGWMSESGDGPALPMSIHAHTRMPSSFGADCHAGYTRHLPPS
jgi:hypothetical protein